MSQLKQAFHWFSALVLIFGAFFVVIFSAGSALNEIGSWSLVVWVAVVLVGLLQAYVLFELAKQFPFKAGGTATYASEIFRGKARVLAFLSGWGYWIAWTPAIALNSYLCAGLINVVLGTSFSSLVLALLVMAFLYALNYFGIPNVVFSSYVLAVLVFVPLLVLVYLAFQTVTPDKLALTFSFANAPTWVVFLKWFFVIAWTGYAVEMISSVIAETKAKERNLPRLFGAASVWSVVAFVGIPVLLALITDWKTLSQDPFNSLQPLFVSQLGQGGATLLSLMLIGALLYSSLAFIVPSTRTFYQMAQDGLLPPFFASVSRFGSPKGSLVVDVVFNTFLLIIFQNRLIEMLAVANVGYMVVFVLLPIAYYLYLKTYRGGVSALNGVIIGVLLSVNLLALVVGGLAWGWFVFGVGGLLVLAGIPIFLLQGQPQLNRQAQN